MINKKELINNTISDLQRNKDTTLEAISSIMAHGDAIGAAKKEGDQIFLNPDEKHILKLDPNQLTALYFLVMLGTNIVFPDYVDMLLEAQEEEE